MVNDKKVKGRSNPTFMELKYIRTCKEITKQGVF